MKKEVDVEYVRWLQAEKDKINKIPLKDIQFIENKKPLDIPNDVIEDFRFVGLLNTDFILTDAYKDKPERRS